jgi:tetratricopeptide (TPR) repeat protein
MADEDKRVRDEYRRSLDAYGEALKRRDPNAPALFVQAGAIWERLCSFGGPEAERPEMYVVLAFFHAVAAADPEEAKRLYDLMSPECQRQTDLADARYHLSPGSMKIWLRKANEAPFVDAVLEQRDPARARLAVEYEHWKRQADELPSALAFQRLGQSCESLGRFEEAMGAYGYAADHAEAEGDERLRDSVEERIRALFEASRRGI